jgi:hypothetical protein
LADEAGASGKLFLEGALHSDRFRILLKGDRSFGGGHRPLEISTPTKPLFDELLQEGKVSKRTPNPNSFAGAELDVESPALVPRDSGNIFPPVFSPSKRRIVNPPGLNATLPPNQAIARLACQSTTSHIAPPATLETLRPFS